MSQLFTQRKLVPDLEMLWPNIGNVRRERFIEPFHPLSRNDNYHISATNRPYFKMTEIPSDSSFVHNLAENQWF